MGWGTFPDPCPHPRPAAPTHPAPCPSPHTACHPGHTSSTPRKEQRHVHIQMPVPRAGDLGDFCFLFLAVFFYILKICYE